MGLLIYATMPSNIQDVSSFEEFDSFGGFSFLKDISLLAITRGTESAMYSVKVLSGIKHVIHIMYKIVQASRI